MEATASREIQRHRLANGLDVVLHPDRALPLVAVNLWYHVGSKNERPGRTGFAHLFEHMLFQGSAHVGTNDHFRHLQRIGGVANGSTWYDRTNYYETVPAQELELALWLESDRMGFLLPALDQAKLDNQRDVVMNERRQRVDNQPYGRPYERLFELLVPSDHPYHWPVIGTMEDIAAATLDDVRAFFRTWYVPNNAVLTIAGDFEPAAALDRVERWFGEIPAGPAPQRRRSPAPPLERAVVETVDRPGAAAEDLPRLPHGALRRAGVVRRRRCSRPFSPAASRARSTTIWSTTVRSRRTSPPTSTRPKRSASSWWSRPPSLESRSKRSPAPCAAISIARAPRRPERLTSSAPGTRLSPASTAISRRSSIAPTSSRCTRRSSTARSSPGRRPRATSSWRPTRLAQFAPRPARGRARGRAHGGPVRERGMSPAVDRSQPPTSGPPRRFRFPRFERRHLGQRTRGPARPRRQRPHRRARRCCCRLAPSGIRSNGPGSRR